MSSDLILKEARTLPLAEQIDLCRALWNEIANSSRLTPGEAELIDQRLQDHLDHPQDLISLDDLKNELKAKFQR